MNSPQNLSEEEQAQPTMQRGAGMHHPQHTMAAGLSALGAAGLVGCGGGGDGAADAGLSSDGAAGNPVRSVRTMSLQAAAAPTDVEASRFLSQAGFGGNATSIAEVKTLGYSGWLDKQIAMGRSQSHKDWLIANGFHLAGYHNAPGGWNQTLWRKLFTSPDALRMRMFLVWSELFVVSWLGVNTLNHRNFLMAEYMDVLERNALGNFRTMLQEVTLSSAMGSYLNMKGNRKANTATGSVPDENYAREVMQLFTIGLYELHEDGTYKLDGNGRPIETYTNEDIQGLAAVFTGWELSSQTDPNGVLVIGDSYRHTLPMVMNERWHSTTEKRFLGTVIPAGTDGTASLRIALDTLFNHANTPPFVARHLIKFFVTSNPSGAYIRRVVQVFKNNGSGVRGDLAATIRAVLLDDEARQAPAVSSYQGKLREPVIRLLQWGRTFGVTTTNLYDLDPAKIPRDDIGLETNFNQFPFYSPSVFNFFRPGYVPPNTRLASQGLVAPEFQITTEPSIVGYINYLQICVDNLKGIRAVYGVSELSLAGNSQALVDRYNLWFAAGQLSASTVQTIKTALDSINAGTQAGQLQRIKACVLLIMASPEYIVLK